MAENRIYIFFSATFLVLAIILMHFGCKHDPVYPEVCFESDVLPIFQNNCTMAGCHNQVDAEEDVILTNYENIMNAGIEAGYTGRSEVYKVLLGGENPMPPDGKLSDNQILIIRSWIENGAENTTGCGISDSNTAGPCDTINVKYSTFIKPLFDVACVSCHSPDSGTDLSTYGALSGFLSGDAQKLLDNINYVGGSDPMPPTGKLDECTLKKIKIWIQAGYPNN